MENKKKDKKKRKYGIIIGVLVFIILASLGVYLYIDNNYIAPFEVNDEITIEYGDEIPEGFNNYIKVTDEKKFKKEDLVISNQTNNMKVGVYDCYIGWKKTEGVCKVVVKDTTPPVIKIKDEKIKIKYNGNYNLEDNIQKVYDKVDGELEFKINGELDNKKEGDQNFKVIVEDKNGNKTTKSFIINVGKKPDWPKTYEDETGKITIIKEWYKNAWVYAAHIEFSDYDRLKTTTCSGGNETTSAAAERLSAILTINGDYSSDHSGGIVRDGKVLRDHGYCDAPGVYNQSTGILEYGKKLNGSLTSLVNSGRITDTFNFCKESVYINNGVLASNRWGDSRAQRTFMGTNGKAGDIWLCVSDGRYNDGESAGLTYLECGQYLQTKGCTFALPLDGGGSSTMVFEGEVLNAEKGHERAVVDFVYFR